MNRLNPFKKGKTKKKSIATPVAISLTGFMTVMLIVILLSLYYFSSIRYSITEFSEQAVQGTVNSFSLSDEVKQLLIYTERLMASESNPERRIAYEKISETLSKIHEIQASRKFNDVNVQEHIEVAESTLNDLNLLTAERITLQEDAWARMEELLNYPGTYEEHSLNQEGIKHYTDREKDNTTAEWYMQSLKIIKTAAAVYPKKILYDIRESEKEILRQFDELERITDRLPERLKPSLINNSEKIRKLVLEENGIINILKKKTKLSLKATSRGNFARTLLKDFVYISTNIMNRVIEYSELYTERLRRIINSFFIVFSVISVLALAVSISISVFIRKIMIKRIITLNNEILEKVAGFDIGVTVKGNDEITDMAKSFLFYENEVKKREAELREIASLDFLTETCNRRHFLELAEKEFARSSRYNYSVSLLMIDIDFFKKINDTYGHHTGDIVLKKFSFLCREIIRESDIFGRIGGEEFSILLPETDLKDGMIFAERLRKAVEDTEWDIEKIKISFTISIGVSECTENPECTVEEVIKKADSALYRAKENGRNKVCSEL